MSYQITISLVRFDERGEHGYLVERVPIVVTSAEGSDAEAVIAKAMTKFRRMLDAEQGIDLYALPQPKEPS